MAEYPHSACIHPDDRRDQPCDSAQLPSELLSVSCDPVAAIFDEASPTARTRSATSRGGRLIYSFGLLFYLQRIQRTNGCAQMQF